MAKRKSPTDIAVGRAGNYAAPIDYSGVDKSMEHELKGYPQRPGESDSSYMKRQRTRVNVARRVKGVSPLKKQKGMAG